MRTTRKKSIALNCHPVGIKINLAGWLLPDDTWSDAHLTSQGFKPLTFKISSKTQIGLVRVLLQNVSFVYLHTINQNLNAQISTLITFGSFLYWVETLYTFLIKPLCFPVIKIRSSVNNWTDSRTHVYSIQVKQQPEVAVTYSRQQQLSLGKKLGANTNWTWAKLIDEDSGSLFTD